MLVRLVVVLLTLFGLQAITMQRADAVPTFNGGWTQPLNSMPSPSAGFMANNCGYSGYGSYISGKYHIANDYGVGAGTAVYSIGSGTVVAVQTGWPGAAVFVRYTASDGTQFLAVYGHINNNVGAGSTVSAGQQVGTVYDQGGNDHLHFGVRASTAPASSNNGSMSCSSWPDTNGYVNPLPFLSAHPIQSTPTSGTETRLGVAVGGTGGLVVFGRGTDNQFYHTWQSSPTSGWSPFNLVVSGGNIESSPEVYKHSDGVFSAYAVNTNSTLVATWQNSVGSTWQPWTAFAGSGVSVDGKPSVHVGGTGGLLLFVRGTDGQLYHAWQSSPGSNWTGLQLVVSGGGLTSDPLIRKDSSGRFSAYAVDSNDHLVATWQNTVGGNWVPWTTFAGTTPVAGTPSIEIGGTGGMVLFVRGTDGQLYHAWQSSPGSNWGSLTPVVGGGGIASSPTIYKHSNGVFSAYAVNSQGVLVATWQNSVGSTWQPWTAFAGSTAVSGVPTIVTGATGGLVLFVRGTDQQLYHTYQPSPGSNWTSLHLVTGGAVLG